MDVLFASYHDQDKAVRAGCLECIGLVGAVDPARLIIRELESGELSLIINIKHDF